jgi:hypothetical protein
MLGPLWRAPECDPAGETNSTVTPPEFPPKKHFGYLPVCAVQNRLVCQEIDLTRRFLMIWFTFLAKQTIITQYHIFQGQLN